MSRPDDPDRGRDHELESARPEWNPDDAPGRVYAWVDLPKGGILRARASECEVNATEYVEVVTADGADCVQLLESKDSNRIMQAYNRLVEELATREGSV